MHQGPVVVCGPKFSREPAYVSGKYVRYELHTPDPGVFQDLQRVVIDEVMGKGIEINGKRDKEDDSRKVRQGPLGHRQYDTPLLFDSNWFIQFSGRQFIFSFFENRFQGYSALPPDRV